MFRLLRNFIFRTKRRNLTIKALFLSGVARFRIYFYPGKALYKYLGNLGEETSQDAMENDAIRDVYFVSDKVARVAKRVPWESQCLVQAMVAQRLLRGYGLNSTLYLGVGRAADEGNKMVAHAWVRCGPYYVCGGNGHTYARVATFTM